MAEMTDDEFEAALEGVTFRIWFCPVRRWHPQTPGPTVEWVDEVAWCTYGPCGRSSTDPTPRRECVCDTYDCAGECCGPGNCTCTTDLGPDGGRA